MEKGTIKVVVGSESVLKLSAVGLACDQVDWIEDYEVSGVKVDSRVNAQPIGSSETYTGALNRAVAAKGKRKASIFVGIENGLILFGDEANLKIRSVFLDTAYVVLLVGGRKIVTSSVGIEIPEQFFDKTALRGLSKTTVGQVIAENLGGNPSDPHAVLTRFNLSRKELLVQALVAAFKQVYLGDLAEIM